jgi:hypothetical protein
MTRHHKHAHKVKRHRWNDGVLRIDEFYFEDFKSAHVFANKSREYVSKIYNVDGELVFQTNLDGTCESYA